MIITFRFKGEFLEVKRATEPDVILWQNQHYTNTSRILRRVFVIFISCLVLMVCLTIVAVANHYQENVGEQYETDFCENLEITMDQAYADTLLPKEKQTKLLGCFCLNQLRIIYWEVAELVFPNDQKMCTDWLKGYSLSTAMISTTAIVVEIINEVIVGILMCKLFLNKISRVE